MKSRIAVAVVALCAVAGLAQAQPYYARGEFNGWSGTSNQFADMGGGMWQTSITGLTPGSAYQFKETIDDWSVNTPTSGGNAIALANAAGVLTLNFFPNTSWADGYQPATEARIGYVDSGQHGWDIMGDFNGWSSPAGVMASLGSGVYQVTVPASVGSHEFKFRKDGDWNVNIGADFGKEFNNAVAVVNAGDTGLQLTLDLPNGRWRAVSVPAPSAMALLGLGGLVATRRRRA